MHYDEDLEDSASIAETECNREFATCAAYSFSGLGWTKKFNVTLHRCSFASKRGQTVRQHYFCQEIRRGESGKTQTFGHVSDGKNLLGIMN